MLIYHYTYDESGQERDMADVLDESREAWIVRTRCTDEVDGEEYEMLRCFVFEHEERAGLPIMRIMEEIYSKYSEFSPEEIVSICRIDPGEEAAVDTMVDYRPNYLPALREAM
jgi:hypothetical protein